MSTVTFTEPAAKSLGRTPEEARRRILDVLEELEESDSPSSRLQSIPEREIWGLRAGDYRVLVDWDQADDEVTVLGLRDRRNDSDPEPAVLDS